MPNLRAILTTTLVLALAGGGGIALMQLAKRAPAATVATAPENVPVPGVRYKPTHVVAAMKEGLVDLELRGDGHSTLQVTALNRTGAALELVFQSGMVAISENQKAELLLPRNASVFLMPGQAMRTSIAVTPGSCRNQRRVHPYLISLHRYEVLEPFWAYLADHPEVGLDVTRTAVLIVKENLPLSAFARFDLSSGPKPETVVKSGLEVETREIMEALRILRRAGYPSEKFAILVDPQLQLEALLDPLTRAGAKRYFALTDADEWAFWSRELTQGNSRTRHYALYAIARFYPDVAIQMLPQWARFKELSLPMRRAAILALAEVPRPEAEGLLAQLEYEMGESSPLAPTVTQALGYWARNAQPGRTMDAALAFQTDDSEPEVGDRLEMAFQTELAEPEPAAPVLPASTATSTAADFDIIGMAIAAAAAEKGELEAETLRLTLLAQQLVSAQLGAALGRPALHPLAGGMLALNAAFPPAVEHEQERYEQEFEDLNRTLEIAQRLGGYQAMAVVAALPPAGASFAFGLPQVGFAQAMHLLELSSPLEEVSSEAAPTEGSVSNPEREAAKELASTRAERSGG